MPTDFPQPPQPEQRRVEQPPRPPVDTEAANRALAEGADKRMRPEAAKPAEKPTDNGRGLPPIPQDRSKYVEAPVFRLQDQMQKSGMSDQKIEGLRAELRANPDLADKIAGGDRDNAALLRDFAKIDTSPRERFIQPTPEVDRLLHQALGKDPGRYVSQEDLNKLTNDRDLRGSGLSQSDVASVQKYLKETGRQLHDDGGDPLVMASDGKTMPKSEYGAHQMNREINANHNAPITDLGARAAGAPLEMREHITELSKTITEAAGAAVSHAQTVRESAKPTPLDPPGIPRTVNEKPPAAPEVRIRTAESPGPKPEGIAPRDGGVKIVSENAVRIPPGMSYNEVMEDASIKRYDPGATPTVLKQPGVDWVRGDRKITTTQDVSPDGQIRVQQNVSGGEWVAAKRLDPQAAPGTEAVRGLTAKTPPETRVASAVDSACKKFENPVQGNEARASVTMDDGTKLTMRLTDPTALVIHIEVPNLSQMPPARQADLQRIATERVLHKTSETPGFIHGKPIHARVVEAP
ncbi:hypothetical protein NLX83_30945 [Allokutzneria sp. A3M-2-11 16]|uniref:hypothetical protein n=1 Tax=Allokutzneria sp. A3M-2-11 16 TaxID=2962043 RepID=UPI0020B72DBD|nr:hypothetical protein [Allokutzneria sp. A3M-2-11 16]MCP3803698.1 hypothetical protein [Allokutzneria sp. A3M-2-11 16]